MTSCGTIINIGLTTPYMSSSSRVLRESSRGRLTQNVDYLYNWNSQVAFGKKYVINAYKKAKVEETYFGMNEEPIDVIKNNFKDHILGFS